MTEIQVQAVAEFQGSGGQQTQPAVAFQGNGRVSPEGVIQLS
ncbi:hypothetical protein [Rubinisphaera sp. JC750]|nr:hypothetical protein [Rubinisphaera sp. JC750]